MIPVLLEGDVDVPMVEKLLHHVGLEIGTVYGLQGKGQVDRRLRNYNAAARHAPWFVLRDLNGDAHCAPGLIRDLLPAPARQMCFRIAVRAAEAWMLADRERAAGFLSVREAWIPENPDELERPKVELVRLARRSRRRAVRRDMVPSEGTSGVVGPGYSARMIEFIVNHWRPEVAAMRSPSLARSIEAMRTWAANIVR